MSTANRADVCIIKVLRCQHKLTFNAKCPTKMLKEIAISACFWSHVRMSKLKKKKKKEAFSGILKMRFGIPAWYGIPLYFYRKEKNQLFFQIPKIECSPVDLHT